MSEKCEREFKRRRSLKKRALELLSEKNQLISELDSLKNQPTCGHNECGAGRKPFAVPEQVNEIIPLHNKKFSYFQILNRLNLS